MNKKVLDHIKIERELSRFKVKVLRGKPELTKTLENIIKLEEEFLSIEFESMDFDTVQNISQAISDFRESPKKFYKKYKLIQSEDEIYDAEHYLEVKSRLLKYANSLISKKVREVNVVQNSVFFSELVTSISRKNGDSYENNSRYLSRLSHQDLSNLEQSSLKKKRARLQIATMALGLFLQKLVEKKGLTYKELKQMEKHDFYQLFSFYNKSIEVTCLNTVNSLGENNFILKSKRIRNLLDQKEDLPAEDFRLIGPDRNLSRNTRRILTVFDTKFTVPNDRSKGIMFPIQRVGNERMSLLGKRIVVNGIDATRLLLNHISNIKVRVGLSVIYYKGVLLYGRKELSPDDQKIFDQVDRGMVDLKSSYMLAATTRSEDLGISEITSIIDVNIQDIMDIIAR